MTAPPECAGIATTAAYHWFFRKYVWPVFRVAYIDAPDPAAGRLRIAAVDLGAIGVVCAGYLVHDGRAVLASGSHPPPARISRAPLVVRGKAAHGRSWGYAVCGVVALAACLGPTAYPHGVPADLPRFGTDETATPAAAGVAAASP